MSSSMSSSVNILQAILEKYKIPTIISNKHIEAEIQCYDRYGNDKHFASKVLERLQNNGYKSDRSCHTDYFDFHNTSIRYNKSLSESIYKKRITTIGLSDFYVTMNVKKEEPIAITNKNPIIGTIRQKERQTFVVDKDGWKIDVTKVTTINNKKGIPLSDITDTNNVENKVEEEKWEIELELLDNLIINKVGLRMFCKQIIHWLKCIYGDIGDLVTKECYDIVVDEFKRYIPTHKFYSRPVNLPVQQISTLSNNFKVSYKADGYHTFIIQCCCGMYCIEPKYQTFEVNSVDSNSYSSVNIAEGEYIWTKNKKTLYLIFDVLVSNDINICAQPLPQRYKHIDYMCIKADNYSIEKKPIWDVTYKQMETLLSIFNSGDLMVNKQYTVDGLIFTETQKPYDTNLTLYKWKPREHLTVDFQIQKTNGLSLYHTFIFDKNNKLMKTEYEWDDTDMFQNPNKIIPQNDMIIEFGFDSNVKNIIAKRIRVDKEFPNHINVFTNMIHDLKHYIDDTKILEETLKV